MKDIQQILDAEKEAKKSFAKAEKQVEKILVKARQDATQSLLKGKEEVDSTIDQDLKCVQDDLVAEQEKIRASASTKVKQIDTKAQKNRDKAATLLLSAVLDR